MTRGGASGQGSKARPAGARAGSGPSPMAWPNATARVFIEEEAWDRVDPLLVLRVGAASAVVTCRSNG